MRGDDIPLPKRKSIRLKDYDYSNNGVYFVTICTHDRKCLFGDIVVGQGLCSCRLSQIGNIVVEEIDALLIRYPTITISNYVIMPNHIHLIIEIERQEQSPCPTIGDIICALKSITTKKSNLCDNIKGCKIWQFRYYDHIIRNEKEYQKIWEYVDTNPRLWEQDYLYTK